MHVFWRRGYDGASVEDLTRATGLNRSSLYAAWDDKRGLFLAAVERYARTRLATVMATLEGGGSLGEDLAAFFEAVADLSVTEREAGGCLISCALADAAGKDATLRNELQRRFVAMELRLEARLARAAAPGGDSPATLAGLLASTARGMMLRARAGASREEVLAIGRAAARLVTEAVERPSKT